MIILYNYYRPADPARAKEIALCFHRLVALGIPMRVLASEEPPAVPSHVEMVYLPHRPRFQDYLAEQDTLEVNVLLNSDIYFEAPAAAALAEVPAGEFWGLTRHEHYTRAFVPMRDSQDLWCWQGRFAAESPLDFTPGQPGCDNRLAWVAQKGGWRLRNPGRRIPTWHVHASSQRHYGPRVPPPYAYLDPE